MADINLNHIEEIWKTIDELPAYEVSSLGRVRRKINGRLRSPTLNKPDGYLHVPLYRGKKNSQLHRYVHRLVAAAFLGSCPPEHEVNHKNGIRTDNRADNLEWVTSKANKAHAIKHGLMNTQGSNHGMSKLTEDQVREIKQGLAQGTMQKDLAKRYGVCFQTISLIKLGKRWTHV